VSFELYLVCAFLLTSFVAVFYQAFKHLTALIQDVEVGFKQDNPNPFNIDEIKEELLDLVHDVLQNMQPPSAGDHIFGAIGQILQFKMMQMFGDEAPKELVTPELTEEVV